MTTLSPHASLPLQYHPRTAALVRRKVCRLVHGGHGRGNRSDLEQDLWLQLARRHDRFDPSRASLATYHEHVLRRHVVDLIRRHAAQRRAGNRTIRYDPDLHEHVRLTGKDARRQIDLKLDVDAALAELPPDLRDLAEQLKVDCVAGIARRTGRSREAVRLGCRRLATHFQGQGLEPP